jgi:hypothetical protein
LAENLGGSLCFHTFKLHHFFCLSFFYPLFYPKYTIDSKFEENLLNFKLKLDGVLSSNALVFLFENNEFDAKESFEEFIKSAFFLDYFCGPKRTYRNNNKQNQHKHKKFRNSFSNSIATYHSEYFSFPKNDYSYLVAILSGKTNLVSPYQTFITHFQAESIVIKFIFDLTNGEDFEIIEIKNLDFIPYYFGHLTGDSATLITWKNKTLLILTDGTD